MPGSCSKADGKATASVGGESTMEPPPRKEVGCPSAMRESPGNSGPGCMALVVASRGSVAASGVPSVAGLVEESRGSPGTGVEAVAVTLDHHLNTPTYFFLVKLSIIDLGSISVTIPKSTVNSLINSSSISYAGCVAQVFFLNFMMGADFSLLTIMPYDLYVAICQPLQYERVMNRRTCVQMAVNAWISGILYSTLHTGNTFTVTFCADNMVDQFFCEIPQLLKLACSDWNLSEIGALSFSACIVLRCFVFIIVSYVQIFKAVMRIPSEQSRHKAFSTCLPHLTVVSLFVCTGIFAYLKPTSSSASGPDLMVAALYSAVPPVMNPVIYSMRNKEIKSSLRRLTMTGFIVGGTTEYKTATTRSSPDAELEVPGNSPAQRNNSWMDQLP
ncbi:olfactory receptor 14I1-like [Terrapene carolina triunguis]|uniref:olfactory receptor 14I1-like n=1 Tax=Terrapene triunguis TaxID=2587831 RepID=UPI001156482E|nr:olfactory receptor 14I1-like [Terrapene carolina triunguis]